MTYHARFLFLGLIWISFFSCSQESLSPAEIIEAHMTYVYPNGRTSIENITTVANCKGPDGNYITVTESLGEKDYLYFHQNFFYQENFSAVVVDAQTVYAVDESLQVSDTLSETTAWVLKTHEFHKIILQLDDWFSEFKPAPDTVYFSIPSRQLTAKDQWEQPFRLFFDLENGQCIGFQFENQLNPGELLRVFYKDWQPHGDYVLSDKVDIIQGEDQVYSFDFDSVELNKPTFKTLNY